MVTSRQRIATALLKLLLIGIAVPVALSCGEFVLFLAGYASPGRADGAADNARKRPRMVCLGDSFLVGVGPGVGQQQKLTSLLASDMKGWEIVNLGQPGTGPIQYLDSWNKVGKRGKPDLVLTFYYIGNDMFDVYAEARKAGFSVADIEKLLTTWTVEWRPSRLRRAGKALWPRTYGLLQKCKARAERSKSLSATSLEAMAERLAVNTGRKVDAAGAIARIPDRYVGPARNGQLNPWLLATAAVVPEYYRESVAPSAADYVKAFDLGLALIEKIAAECREAGARHYLVIIPAGVQLLPETIEHYRLMGYDTSGILLNFSAQERIVAFCREKRMACLDLTPALLPVAKGAYLEIDGHWTAQGNRVAAEAVLRRLREDGVR
jgi:hypothetical protein